MSENRTTPTWDLRTLDDVREVAIDSSARERASPLAPTKAVLIERTALEAMSGCHDESALVDALRALPCPIIGIGGPMLQPKLLDVLDVVVEDRTAAGAILANVDRAPIAASVLVQVLRMTPKLSVRDGLTLESFAYGTLQAGAEFHTWSASHENPIVAPTTEDRGPAVKMERSADTLVIRLNRPGSRNALSIELRDALCEALQLAIADPTIATLAISGEGRCFSAGGDLSEFGTLPDSATAHAIRNVRQPALLLSQCAERAEFSLHGACIGAGIELPAFGRHVIAAEDSFFQLPEIQFGLIPGSGGCVSLPRRIGRHRTAYLALSGRRISASKGFEWGLVDAVVG